MKYSRLFWRFPIKTIKVEPRPVELLLRLSEKYFYIFNCMIVYYKQNLLSSKLKYLFQISIQIGHLIKIFKISVIKTNLHC